VKSESWQSIPKNQATCSLTNHSKLNVVGAHQSRITKCSHRTLAIVYLCYTSHTTNLCLLTQ